MKEEDYIQDYIAGNLTEQERLLFVKKLDEDIAFAKAYQEHKDLTEAFELQEAKKLKKMLTDLEKDKSKKIFSIPRAALLSMAAVIVVLVTMNLFNQSSGPELYEEFYEVYPNTYKPVVRGADRDTETYAFEAYENGNYADAVIAFESILDEKENLNVRFFYASALLAQSRYNKALEQFQILSDAEHDYRAESLWYSVLIYTQKSQLQKAREYLKRLKREYSQFMPSQRETLLEEIG